MPDWAKHPGGVLPSSGERERRLPTVSGGPYGIDAPMHAVQALASDGAQVTIASSWFQMCGVPKRAIALMFHEG
jgi:hypothetical protein